MSINSNVTDSNTIDMNKLQLADNNEDVPSALTSIGNLVQNKFSWIFGGGEEEDTKQIKQDDEEDIPQQPSTNDASMPTNTSTTLSFTSTANLNTEEEKNDAPQDDLVSAPNKIPNNIPITSVQLFQNNYDSRSIKICRESQLVTKYLQENKKEKDDNKQLTTSTNQLSLSNDTGLSLKLNKSLSTASRNEGLSPNRVSNLSKEETSELGGGNNDGTLVLYTGSNNNNNMNDSVNSSLGDDESIYLSGDTIVNTGNNFQATESSDLQLKLQTLTS